MIKYTWRNFLTKPKAKKTTSRKPVKRATSKSKQRKTLETKADEYVFVEPKEKSIIWEKLIKLIKYYVGFSIFALVISLVFGDATCDSSTNNFPDQSNTGIVPQNVPNIPVVPDNSPNYDSDFDRYAEEQYKELTDEPYFVDNSDSYSNENFGR
jgi:hypothetical protein